MDVGQVFLYSPDVSATVVLATSLMVSDLYGQYRYYVMSVDHSSCRFPKVSFPYRYPFNGPSRLV